MHAERFVVDLKACQTEEAVKATYIRHAGFQAYIKEKVDLYVNSCLFEFKYDVKDLRTNWHRVMAQALIYVHRIQAGLINIPMPSHVALVDKNEAMLFTMDPWLPLVQGDYKWDVPASSPDKKLVSAVKTVQAQALVYDTTDPKQLAEFVSVVRELPTHSSRKIVSAVNFDSVYQSWCVEIGAHLNSESLGPYFVADLREDSVFNARRGMLAFDFDGSSYQVPARTYEQFWSLYGRPPAADVQGLILSRLHMLAPKTRRQTQGAFYTPSSAAIRGSKYLLAAEPGWQDDPNTYLWDPCCGSGNLEEPIGCLDRVFMSTLDIAEIGLLKNLDLFPGAHLFQFDFLNGSYDDLPANLRAVIEDPSKKMIVLMNPPYGEATASIAGGANKTGVSFTRVKEQMLEEGLGQAANELFAQFMYRVAHWMPRATVAMFATLKYAIAPAAAKFRDTVWKYEAVSGFLVPGNIFPGVQGDFPISFIVWKPGVRQTEFELDVFDGKSITPGRKTISDSRDYLNDWFDRPKCTEPAIPLTAALGADKKDKPMLSCNAKHAFGYAGLNSNDPQNNGVVMFMSSVSSRGHGCAVTPDTFEHVLVQVGVRKLVAPTWLNDRDQFQVPLCDRADYKKHLNPGRTNLPNEFIADTVVYALFHGCNNSSTLSGEYHGKAFQLDNQFFPYCSAQVQLWAKHELGIHRAAGRAQETFVCKWLAEHNADLSPEARAVIESGHRLYGAFFHELPNLLRKKYHLNAWNPGYYQVRMALKEAGLGSQELQALSDAHRRLAAKLEPQVYELGFLAR